MNSMLTRIKTHYSDRISSLVDLGEGAGGVCQPVDVVSSAVQRPADPDAAGVVAALADLSERVRVFWGS